MNSTTCHAVTTRLGMSRPASAHPVPDSHLPCCSGRLFAEYSLYPGAGIFAADRTDGSIRTRVGGTALRRAAQRDYHSCRTAIPVERKPAGHELSRTAPLDGMRILRRSGN